MKLYKKLAQVTVALVALTATAGAAQADELMDRAKNGDPIRIGFATEVPYAFPGKDNAPLGYVNKITIDVLTKMGFKNIEPVVTDWGGLIPGLNANRFDIITGGMDITKARCGNVNFSAPISKSGPAFLVPKGNPKGLHTYEDLKTKGATAVTVAGYSMVEQARKVGIADENLMQVPGTTEELAALKAGRVDAVIDNNTTLNHLARQTNGEFEVTDPNAMPMDFKNWVGIAFRKGDQDFLNAFNDVLTKYIGTDEMLKVAAEYEYVPDQLPGDVTTEWVCANR